MRVLRVAVAVGAGFVLGCVGALSVAAVGLVVTAYAARPLALGLAAILAALGAVWAGNLGTPDRARMLPAVVCALGTAAVILVCGAALDSLTGGHFLTGGPWILKLGACVAGVAASAGASAALSRGPRGSLGWEGVTALLLAVCGLAFAYLVSPFGMSPVAATVLPPYAGVSAGGAVVAVAVVTLAVHLARSPGREIGRDALLTLALVAAVVPVFATILSLVCTLPGRCGA